MPTTEYYIKNREKLCQQRRDYYQINREKSIAYSIRYYHLHKEERKEYDKYRRELNRERINEKVKCYNHKLKHNLYQILGGMKCIKCEITDERVLQLDHVNRRAKKDYKSNNTAFYTYYCKNPDLARQDLRVLCANCNWIKKHENKEYRKI